MPPVDAPTPDPTASAPAPVPAAPAAPAPAAAADPAAPAPAAPAAPAPAAAADPAAPAADPAKPAEPAKPAAAPGVPEKYEFTAPEGVELDAEVLTEFEGVARELGLPQDKAQAVIDKLAPKIAAQQKATFEGLLTKADAEWTAASKIDPEFGGEKLDENMAVAKKAWETFGTPELQNLLNTSRMGNHPEIIRWAYRVGKAISEDTIHAGRTAQGAPERTAVLYPTMNQKAN
jgi:hypothetical protein